MATKMVATNYGTFIIFSNGLFLKKKKKGILCLFYGYNIFFYLSEDKKKLFGPWFVCPSSSFSPFVCFVLCSCRRLHIPGGF